MNTRDQASASFSRAYLLRCVCTYVCFLLAYPRGGHFLHSKPNRYLKFSKSLTVFYSLKGFSAWRKPEATWLKFSLSPLGLEPWVTSDSPGPSPLQVSPGLGALSPHGKGPGGELPAAQLHHCALGLSQPSTAEAAAPRSRDGKVPALISFPRGSSCRSPAARRSPPRRRSGSLPAGLQGWAWTPAPASWERARQSHFNHIPANIPTTSAVCAAEAEAAAAARESQC